MNGISFPNGLSQNHAANSCTLLMDSIASDNEPVIRNLIEKNANLESSDKKGNTPLMWGASKGKQKSIALLIKRGANVNAQNLEGQTSLHFAAFEGHLKVVKQLIFAKADVNLLCNEKCSALNYALKNCHYDIADELIREGSNIDVQDTLGLNQLMVASTEGNKEQVKFLLNHKAQLEKVDNTAGLTALIWGATNGHMECTKLLIEANADVNVKGKGRACSLGNAMMSGHAKIVKLLVEAKADLDMLYEFEGEQCIPLINVVISDGFVIARAVIEAKANLEVRDREGITPLIAASLHNRLNIVDLLLKHKADAEARTTIGSTALLMAANKGYNLIVKRLHLAGANINACQNNHVTPLMAALGKEDFNSNASYQHVVEYLLTNGADVNVQNTDGYTALILAAKSGDVSLIEKLIDLGAHIDLKERFVGLTALHVALLYNHKNAFDLLLKRGANPHIPDNEGYSSCAYAFFANREDLIVSILKYGWLSPVEQGFGINTVAVYLTIPGTRRKTKKGNQNKQKERERAQLVERIKCHRAQVLKEQQQKEKERLQRITEEQDRQRKRLIAKVNRDYASPVEFFEPESLLSVTAECKDLALKKLTDEEKKKSAKLNKKPAPIPEDKKAGLDEQKMRELEKNQQLESIQRQFFLKPAIYSIYQRLFKKDEPIKLVEILQLLKALQGIELMGTELGLEGEEIRLIENISENTRGNHVNIKMSRNPQLVKTSESVVSARFVFLRNCENLKDYSIDQACKKLIDLGFGPDYIREENPENLAI